MLAIYLFLLVTAEYYNVSVTITNIMCDNMGAVYTFKQNSKRIPNGAKNNDVQRVLRKVKSKMKSLHLLNHVLYHQDNYRIRSELPLEVHLNYLCDDLAKAAVVDGTLEGVEKRRKLHLESACVFI